MDHRITTAEAYHWATKHIRNRIKPHSLDFANYPDPVKSYDYIGKTNLTKVVSPIDVDLNSLFVPSDSIEIRQGFSFETLSRLLFLACGATKTAHAGGVPFSFRTIPSAGALYPCHLYMAVSSMDGLETGLYYCDMIQGFLGLIQKGENSNREKKDFSCYFIVTGEFFKSAWKYRERAFRYILLDSGHLIENLSLAIKASGLKFSISYDFDDEELSQLLSLDQTREVPLACVTAGYDERIIKDLEASGPTLTGPRAREKKPLSKPIAYPLLQDAYNLGKPVLISKNPGCRNSQELKAQFQKTVPLSDFTDLPVRIDYMDAVIRRRSRRNFASRELAADTAGALIKMASSLFGGEDKGIDPYLEFGISCRNVQDMEEGVYLFSKDRSAFVQISTGSHQNALSRVCLDQKWVSNAGLNFLFMANLSGLEKGLGPRGYRYLLMHSGRIGQRIYLAAAGLKLGCCGVGALYDEEAQTLFKLNHKSALFYVVSAGPVKK